MGATHGRIASGQMLGNSPFPTLLLPCSPCRRHFPRPVRFTEDTVMKARLLILFVPVLVLAFATPGYPGAQVAQVSGPNFSGDGKPEDWGAPQLSVAGKPDDWGFRSYAISGRPTDWDSVAGLPEDWGTPASSQVRSLGRPEDWGSPWSSLRMLGKPEDWEGPARWFQNPVFWLFHFE